MEPARGIEPRLPPYQGDVLAVVTKQARDLGVLGGSRTRSRRLLKSPSLPSWSTSTRSRRPVPTRAVRCTKAEPQPCAAASLPLLDLNQDFRNQNPASCQLDEKALSEGAIRAPFPALPLARAGYARKVPLLPRHSQ
jgi:hypothetical protein